MKNLALMTVLLTFVACGGNGDGDAAKKPEAAPPETAKLPWHLARSADGKFLCEIERVLPEETPEGAEETVVCLEFVFPDPEVNAIFDRDVSVPRAIRPDGENLAGPWSMMPLQITPSGVSIPDLRLGAKVDRIALLQVDAIAAHVLDEEQFTFENLGLGESEKLRCRAFELVVTGAKNSCTVLVEKFPEFAEEHAEYHFVVPPTVASPQWGLRAVRILDKNGNRLVQVGGGGGADSSLGDFQAPGSTGEEVLPIAYPLTVKIAIPTRVRAENVVFQFKDIPMVPYAKER